jgi:hypothetical protein
MNNVIIRHLNLTTVKIKRQTFVCIFESLFTAKRTKLLSVTQKCLKANLCCRQKGICLGLARKMPYFFIRLSPQIEFFRELIIKKVNIRNFNKIRPVGAALIHVNGKTDRTNIIDAFTIRQRRLKKTADIFLGKLAGLRKETRRFMFVCSSICLPSARNSAHTGQILIKLDI